MRVDMTLGFYNLRNNMDFCAILIEYTSMSTNMQTVKIIPFKTSCGVIFSCGNYSLAIEIIKFRIIVVSLNILNARQYRIR